VAYELNPIERAVVEALAGDEVSDRDIQDADETPDEWCAECIGRRPAAVNAARIGLEAAFAAGMRPLADVLDALRDWKAFSAWYERRWGEPVHGAPSMGAAVPYLAERFAPTAPEGADERNGHG
jgi:hypothetical protein